MLVILSIMQWIILTLTMGAVLTNVGPGVSFGDGEEDPLPTKLGLGLGYLALEGKANIAFDLNYEVNDQSMVTNLGVEYYLVEDFALRAGFMNDPSGDLSYTTLRFRCSYRCSWI